MLKQIFTSNKKSGVERTNYLLMSIYEQILDFDLPAHLDEVDLTFEKKDKHENAKEYISTYIFTLIFES